MAKNGFPEVLDPRIPVLVSSRWFCYRGVAEVEIMDFKEITILEIPGFQKMEK